VSLVFGIGVMVESGSAAAASEDLQNISA